MTEKNANGERPMSKRALARALGVSPSAVLKLEGRGMPVDSPDAARAWRAANLDPNRIKGSASRAERNGRADELMAARLDREQSEAALARLRLGELNGELVRADDWAAALGRAVSTMRDAFLNVPHRLSPVLAAESDPARVFLLLDLEMRESLALIAGGGHPACKVSADG